MGTTRTPINRPPTSRITPEAVECYRRAIEAENEDEARELRTQLHHYLLKRKPWQSTVFSIGDADQPPSWMRNEDVTDWYGAYELKQALDAALEEMP